VCKARESFYYYWVFFFFFFSACKASDATLQLSIQQWHLPQLRALAKAYSALASLVWTLSLVVVAEMPLCQSPVQQLHCQQATKLARHTPYAGKQGAWTRFLTGLKLG